MTYVFGILGIGIGVLFVLKTEWFVENFGSNAWAEQHLGSEGGTRLMYKLLGILFIFIAMMAMTGLLGPFIISIFGRLFGIKN